MMISDVAGSVDDLITNMHGVQGAGGSNPLIPTSKYKGLRLFRSPFFVPKIQRGTKWGTKSSPLENEQKPIQREPYRPFFHK